MALNELPTLDPESDEVLDAEVIVDDDVLVKAFAVGPGGVLDPHEHPDCTNVFHLLSGTVTVTSGETTETLSAPAVVHNEPGTAHGVENDGDEAALLTASLCPMPG